MRSVRKSLFMAAVVLAVGAAGASAASAAECRGGRCSVGADGDCCHRSGPVRRVFAARPVRRVLNARPVRRLLERAPVRSFLFRRCY